MLNLFAPTNTLQVSLMLCLVIVFFFLARWACSTLIRLQTRDDPQHEPVHNTVRQRVAALLETAPQPASDTLLPPMFDHRVIPSDDLLGIMVFEATIRLIRTNWVPMVGGNNGGIAIVTKHQIMAFVLADFVRHRPAINDGVLRYISRRLRELVNCRELKAQLDGAGWFVFVDTPELMRVYEFSYVLACMPQHLPEQLRPRAGDTGEGWVELPPMPPIVNSQPPLRRLHYPSN